MLDLIFETVLASTGFANANYYGFGRSDSANSGFFSMVKNKILVKYILMTNHTSKYYALQVLLGRVLVIK